MIWNSHKLLLSKIMIRSLRMLPPIVKNRRSQTRRNQLLTTARTKGQKKRTKVPMKGPLKTKTFSKRSQANLRRIARKMPGIMGFRIILCRKSSESNKIFFKTMVLS